MAEEIRKITEKDIERISELYRISQTEEGLTEEEKKEQAELRKAYIMAIRRNLRGTLENIDLVDENGNVVKSLGEKGK
ncbi:MAG: DUF896 domain-containing protein [Eubacteriales bacterium]|nr:DUF896 domain-containing protein [Lachnospiraceae bacterium]MDO4808838.1 DUF896 domain-containing protein [Eubacteriales bacterium]